MLRLRGVVRGGRLLLALVVGGAVFGIATAVQASIPDSKGVIHACYLKSAAPGTQPGALRVIDTPLGQACQPTEGTLTWNQHGPTGPTGPPGPAVAPDIWSAAVAPPNPAIALTNSQTIVLTKSVPVGTFLIQAKLGAHAGTAHLSVFCSLTPDNLVTQWDNSGNSTNTLGDEIDLPLQAVETLAAPTTIQLYCASSGPAFADWVKLTALPIGTVH